MMTPNNNNNDAKTIERKENFEKETPKNPSAVAKNVKIFVATKTKIPATTQSRVLGLLIKSRFESDVDAITLYYLRKEFELVPIKVVRRMIREHMNKYNRQTTVTILRKRVLIDEINALNVSTSEEILGALSLSIYRESHIVESTKCIGIIPQSGIDNIVPQMNLLAGLGQQFTVGVEESIDDFTETIKNFKLDLNPEIKNSIDNLTNTIQHKQLFFSNNVEAFISKFVPKGQETDKLRDYIESSDFNPEFKDKARAMLTENKGMDMGIAGLTILGFASIHYAVYKDTVSKTLMLFSGAVCLTYVPSLALELMKIMNFEISDIIKPQMGEDEIEMIVNSILGLFAAYVAATTSKKITAATLFAGLSNYQRVKTSATSIFTFIIEVIEKVINYFRDESLMPVRLLVSNLPVLKRFCKQSDGLLNRNAIGKLYRNTDSAAELQSMLIEGQKLYSSLKRDRANENAVRLLEAHLKKLDTLNEMFKASKIETCGTKQEPVGVLLQGAPGVGKSITMEHITHAVIARTASSEIFEAYKKNPHNFVFNRQFENKFWDGYKNESIVCTIDDFGQAKDVAGSPDNEFMNILRAINGFETMLHMANMQEKGRVNFNSKFVVCSTNMVKLHAESIISDDALNRRFPVRVLVVPRKEFCVDPHVGHYSKKIDVDKLPLATIDSFNHNSLVESGNYEDRFRHSRHSGSVITSLSPDIQEFIRTDRNGIPYGEPMDFHELVDIIVEHFFENEARHILAKQQFEETAMSYRYGFEHQGTDFGPCDDEYSDDEEEEIQMGTVSPQSNIDRDTSSNFAAFLSLYFDEDTINHAYKIYYIVKKENHEKEVLRLWRRIPDLIRNIPARDLLIFTLCSHFKIVGISDPMGADLIPSSLSGMPYLTFFGAAAKIYHSAKGVLADLKQVVLPSFVNTLMKIVEYKNWIIIAIGLFFTKKIVNKVSTYFAGSKQEVLWDPKEEIKSQSMGLSDKMAQAKVSHFTKLARNVPQGGTMDKSGWSLMQRIIKTNVFSIVWNKAPNITNNLGYLTMLKGRIGIMPFHFIVTLIRTMESEPLMAKSIITFVKSGTESFKYTISISDLVKCYFGDTKLYEKDLCFVDLSSIGFQPCKNILEHVISDNKLSTLGKNMDCALFRGGSMPSTTIVVAKPCLSKIRIDSQITGWYEVLNAYNYNAVTFPGDCGSILSYMNASLPQDKICGFHIAAQTDAGIAFSTSVSREFLREYLDKYMDIIPIENEFDEFDGTIISQGQFNYLGKIPKAVGRMQHSSISKSHLHDTYTISKNGFALLGPRFIDNKLVDPTENALKKYCIGEGNINIEVLNSSIDSFTDFLNSKVASESRKFILTVEEALDGVVGNEFIRKFPSSTSAGYPSNVGELNIKKMYYYGEPTEKKKALDLITDEAYLVIKDAKEGIRRNWYCTFFLKDEKRPKEKVLSGSTRGVMGTPFGYAVPFKMLFGAFMGYCLENKINNSMMSGVNPYSSSWDIVARLLIAKSDGLVGAGDFSGFDGRQRAALLMAPLAMINAWYNDEYSFAREVLWMEVLNSKNIVGDVAFEMFESLPSGHPLTLIINCMVNNLLFRSCWILADLPILEFNNCVTLFVQGDDNIFAIDPKYHEVFNEITLVPLMAQLGQKYTTELKGEATVPFRHITEVEFLKRSFRFEERLGRYLAPLRLDVILDIPMWTKKGSDRDNITISNTSEALRELSLHDEGVYNKWYPKIRDEFLKHYAGYDTNLPITMNWCDRMLYTCNNEKYFYC